MKRKILNGGSALIARQLVSLPLNILGIFYISRVLDTSDFSVQAVLVPAISFTLLFSDLGTSKALVQSTLNAHRTLAYQIQIIKHVGAFICLLTLTGISFILVNTDFFPQYFFYILPFAALLGLLQSQRNYFSIPLQRDIQWQILAKIEMAEIVLYNAVLILAAHLTKSAYCFPFALAARYTTGLVLLAVINKYVIKHVYNQTGSRNIKSLLKFGFPLQATEIFGILNGLVNPVLVGSFMGANAVGIVNWCMTIISIPKAPLQPLPGFLFSILSARSRMARNDNRFVGGIAFITTLLMSLISLIIAVSLDWLIYTVFSEKWAQASAVALILLLSNVFIMPTMLIVAQMSARGLSITWLTANVLGSSLLWIATFFGIKLFELEGFAIGWVLASFFPLLLLSVKASKHIRLNIHWFDSLYVISVMILSYFLSRFIVLDQSLSLFSEILIKNSISSFAFLLLLTPLLYKRKALLLATWTTFFK